MSDWYACMYVRVRRRFKRRGIKKTWKKRQKYQILHQTEIGDEVLINSDKSSDLLHVAKNLTRVCTKLLFFLFS